MSYKDETVRLLKNEYISFYKDCPIQKYAAMYIGRDEDTVIRWRKDDSIFAGAVERVKADWVRKKLQASKAEFALERLEKEVFASKYMEERTHEGIVIYKPEKYPSLDEATPERPCDS